jgi:hypothetical protein
MIEILPHLAPLQHLRAAFLRHDRDIRVVGGCVRDILLGNVPADIDLCTNATPDEQHSIYEAEGIHHIDTGLHHGTYTVVISENGDYFSKQDGPKIVLEITSLRIDTNHDGRHADVIYTHDWLRDLSRRDLTINAMALTFDDELIDPHHGAEDLKNHRVVFVGNTRERIREDYLRILRWFRFSARYADGILNQDVCAALAEEDIQAGLKKISRERIWSEMAKIVSGPHGPAMVIAILDLGLDRYMDLPNGRSSTVWNATRNAVWRLLMAHDHTHNPVSLMAAFCGNVDIVGDLARDWKWSVDERHQGKQVCNLMYKFEYMLKDYKRFAVLGSYKPWLSEALRVGQKTKWADELDAWSIPVLPVAGADIVAMGVAPGPEVGKLHRLMRDRWIESNYTMSKADCLALLAEA